MKNYKDKKCLECGNIYTPTVDLQLTCETCGITIKERKEAINKEKICVECGELFTTLGPKQRKCSKCTDRKRLKPKTCTKCGKVYDPLTHKQIVCQECKNAPKEKRVFSFKEIECDKCSSLFTPNSSTQKTCDSCKPQKWTYDANRQISCIVCGKMFNPISKNNTKCSDECCRVYAVNNRRETRNKAREDKFKNSIEGIDYIKCEICGVKAEQLHATHFNHVHGISTEEYLKLYPNAKLMSERHIQSLTNERNRDYKNIFRSNIANNFISRVLSISNKRKHFLYGECELKIPTQRYYYMYDLTNTKTKRIIEFNGDFWHCNPSIYSHDFLNKKKKLLASEIWKRDNEKIEFAKSLGYEVMVVWEKEYREDSEGTIKKCREFIL